MSPLDPGPLPATYLLPAKHLQDLLVTQRQHERLIAFLGAQIVEPSFARHHSADGNRPWIMGYSIETEHRGCYTFRELARGTEWREVVDAGLDAWDRQCAEWESAQSGL